MEPFALGIFIFALGLGTTTVFASSHWMLAWMGLEINTLAIIPMMLFPYHPRAVEAAVKYFLAQATASALLLFATMINAWHLGEWDIHQLTYPPAITLACCALGFKLGLAPMHAWVPEVLQGLNLFMGLMILTWQKLAPFILLLQIHPATPTLLLLLGALSIAIGGWGGLAQPHIRKLLAYSSIAHIGWMMVVIPFSSPLALLGLFMYFTLTVATIFLLMVSNSTTLNKMASSSPKIPFILIAIALLLLSLAGLPPLGGFGPKLFILAELVYQDLYLMALLVATTGLIALYFYLRLVYYVALTKTPSSLSGLPLLHFTPKIKTLLMCMLWLLAVAALPIIPGAISLLTPLPQL